MTPKQTEKTSAILLELLAERVMQDAKHGAPNLPNGTGHHSYTESAQMWKEAVDYCTEQGTLKHASVFQEEVFEALAESDPIKLRAELVQVAAYAVKWIEAIDREAVK